MSTPLHLASARSRRRFVGDCARVCACAVASSLLGACASVLTRPVTPVNGRILLPLVQYPELAEPGGSLKILPDGASDPLYVLALGGGAFTVLSPICTHLGCTVDIQGERLVCPCHGSTYDRRGNVLQGPAERPLERLAASLSADGVLTIDLSRGA